MFDYMDHGPFLYQPMFKTITWLLLSLEPSAPCVRNLHQHAPETSWTCLRNTHQQAPEFSGICRNPPEPSGTLRNPPEPSGTCLWNLHQRQNSLELLRNSPELSGTCLWNLDQHTPFWNLSPEPAPATRTGTHRSLSGLKTPLACAVGEKTWNKSSKNFITIHIKLEVIRTPKLGIWKQR